MWRMKNRGKSLNLKGCCGVADWNALFPDFEGGGSEKQKKEQGREVIIWQE